MTQLLRGLAVVGVMALTASCSTTSVAPHDSTTPSTTGGIPTTTASTTTTGAGSVADACGVVANPDVIISQDPCQVSTRVGITVHIILDPGFDWETPVSNSNSIEVGDVVKSSSGGLDADLIATQSGRATVSATGSVICPPRQACPALARLWRLQVTVGP